MNIGGILIIYVPNIQLIIALTRNVYYTHSILLLKQEEPRVWIQRKLKIDGSDVLNSIVKWKNRDLIAFVHADKKVFGHLEWNHPIDSRLEAAKLYKIRQYLTIILIFNDKEL